MMSVKKCATLNVFGALGGFVVGIDGFSGLAVDENWNGER
jgi:hypothetical protein